VNGCEELTTAGVQKVRSKVNVVMNRLVGEGIIARFRTSFGQDDDTPSPRVTVTLSEGRSPHEVRALVVNAVAEAAIAIDVTVERLSA
jgi:hypothetical protein